MRKSFMLNFIFTSVVLFLFTNSVSAKVWVVNNAGPGDFTSAQTAVNSAEEGDTLYFTGSSNEYGWVTLTKKLIIIGSGYFLDKNPNTYANKQSVILGIYFNSGSKGSEAIGITGNNSYYLTINTNDIKIRRCNSSIDNSSASDTIRNLSVKQSYVTGIRPLGIFSNSSISNSIIVGQFTSVINSVIENCLYKVTLAGTQFGGLTNTLFVNNIFLLSASGSVSIPIELASNRDPQLLRNNYFDQFSRGIENGYNEGINNIFQYANSTAIFADINSSSTDGKYLLTGTSAANGTGEGETDMGPFGGSEPYILSGLPPIPVIYEINIPTKVNKADGLEIQIKAKIQN